VIFHDPKILADIYKRRNDILHDEHNESWADLLLESVFAALIEDNPEKLYVKLHTLSTITDSWMKDIETNG
jgi:hypothetical protein